MRKILRLSFAFLLMLLISSPMLYAQQRKISGTVLAEDNKTPLQGVTVKVKGTNRVTQTDAQGTFSINASPDETLQFTYVGYQTFEVKAGTGNVQVNLKLTDATMGEVVITALGIKKERKALGYSVTDLSAQELMKNKNTNIINSLAGKVPGVNITQFSGSAGAGASITIRGGNSTSESRQNQPLFVIDGIIYDNSTTVTGNTGTDGLSRSNTTYSDRIMDINPEDIESLSVLKGAAAAALYVDQGRLTVLLLLLQKKAQKVLQELI
jgi:ferric enterobactin receptor